MYFPLQNIIMLKKISTKHKNLSAHTALFVFVLFSTILLSGQLAPSHLCAIQTLTLSPVLFVELEGEKTQCSIPTDMC